MPTGDIHKFGTLCINGEKINVSNEIVEYDKFPYNSKIEIIDSDINEEYLISWVEVNYGQDKMYVCKNNIIKNISWFDLKNSNCIDSLDIKIDGINYILKTLSGYNDINEWDMFICNKIHSPNLPTIDIYDNESIKNHNSFWNWKDISSISSSSLDDKNSLIACRGNFSHDYLLKYSSHIRNIENGWRPILKLDNNKIIPLKQEATINEINDYIEDLHSRLNEQIYLLKSILSNKGIECEGCNTLSQLINKTKEL